MPAIRAVIFDLDDTLFPERAFARSGFQAVAKTYPDLFGDPDTTCRELETLLDTPYRPRIFNEWLSRRGLGEPFDQLVPAIVQTYRTHKPNIELYPDAVASLRALRESYRLGLITDGHSPTQWNKIDALFLRPRLDEMIVTSDIGPEFAKPHTKSFEMMAQCLAVEPQECAYVADNPMKDFVAPNELEWLTVRIIREDGLYRDAAAAPGGEPDHIIALLSELDQALLSASDAPTTSFDVVA